MDRLRILIGQLRTVLLALPPARRASFAALIAAVLVGTIGLAYWVQRPQYRVLFSNLGTTDAGAVVDYLKSEKIPYRVGEGGTSVEVPAGQVYETRLALAGRGVPQGGGVGFEIFDKQTLGMTDFVQRLNYQRALQGELARTIAELAAVEAARVHLALPERSLFVAEERRPSASVVVKLRPGRVLAPDQIAGIVNLVAASVEGLKPADVTVVDIDGKILTHDTEDAQRRPAGEAMLGYQRDIEHGYAERIESMLERVLGPGHALARVTVVLELAQSEKTEETFDPDRVAVRNEKRTRETNVSGPQAGAVGVGAALTNDPQPAAADDRPKSEREDSTLSYEVSKTTSRRVEAVGAIRKLSVAVMIDGTYQGEGASRVFVPRPSEEIDRYRELVKRAVGFNEERGDEIEVVSAPFQSAPPSDTAIDAPGVLERLARWSDALWRGAGLLVTLIVALAVVRPFLLAIASRATAVRTPTAVSGAQVAIGDATRQPAGLIDVVRRNPEQTAQVIKVWLAGDES